MENFNQEIFEKFKNLNRCTQCVLPETFPGIKFDEKGECNYCKTYEPMNPLGEEKFDEFLSKVKGKGKEYDILVPISGGRDSSYVLHQLVTKYKMKVMGITVDSGFTFEEGWRNLETQVKILNIPHVILKNEKRIKIAKKNAKLKFQGWVKHPSINTIVPVINAGDKTMNHQMYMYAQEHSIPLVLGGNNVGNAGVEQEHWKTGFMGVFPNDRGVYSNVDKFKLIFLFGLEFIKNPTNFKSSIIKEYLSGFITYFFDSGKLPEGVQSAGFYDYIYWDEKLILDTIIKDLDWKGAADTETTWRIDDSGYPMINYLIYNLVGFTEHDEMYSKMIREGQINREQALKRLEQDHKPRLVKIEKDFKEFSVTKSELDKSLKKYRKKLLSKFNHYHLLD